MPAYMIILAKITDRERFVRDYAAAAGKLVEQHGGRYLLRAPAGLLLEGTIGDGQSVVISEWPDKVAAMAFWNSPEYKAAKKLRAGAADVQVILVEAAGLTN